MTFYYFIRLRDDSVKKINKKYIYLILTYIFIMFFCTFLDTNVVKIISKYFSNETFKNEIMIIYNNFNFISCLFEIVVDIIKNYEWNFDYIIIWSTNIFQISLPFLAIFGFFNYKNCKNNDKLSFKKLAKKDSIKAAICVFIAYLIFFLLIIIICQGKHSTYITRQFLSDILGDKFYFNHIYLYYLIDGFIKYFIMSYIYIYSGSLLSYTFNDIINNKNVLCYYFIIIYFFLSIVSTILVYIIGDMAIYSGPHSIMIAGTFLNISSLIMFAVNLLPLIISCILFYKKGRKEINEI